MNICFFFFKCAFSLFFSMPMWTPMSEKIWAKVIYLHYPCAYQLVCSEQLDPKQGCPLWDWEDIGNGLYCQWLAVCPISQTFRHTADELMICCLGVRYDTRYYSGISIICSFTTRWRSLRQYHQNSRLFKILKSGHQILRTICICNPLSSIFPAIDSGCWMDFLCSPVSFLLLLTQNFYRIVDFLIRFPNVLAVCRFQVGPQVRYRLVLYFDGPRSCCCNLPSVRR